jgi:hypothetical protein
LIASQSTAGAAAAVPMQPVMLATNKIDAAKVLNEVDFIVPFVCVIAYEASVSRSNGSSGADRDPEAWQTYRNLDQRDAHQARGKS